MIIPNRFTTANELLMSDDGEKFLVIIVQEGRDGFGRPVLEHHIKCMACNRFATDDHLTAPAHREKLGRLLDDLKQEADLIHEARKLELAYMEDGPPGRLDVASSSHHPWVLPGVALPGVARFCRGLDLIKNKSPKRQRPISDSTDYFFEPLDGECGVDKMEVESRETSGHQPSMGADPDKHGRGQPSASHDEKLTPDGKIILDVNRITTGVRMPRRAVLKRLERFATSIRRSTVCALNLDAGGSPSRGPLKSESLAQLKESMLTLCRAQPEIEHVD